MRRLFDFLLDGCFHLWGDSGEVRREKRLSGEFVFMQPVRCTKCGQRRRARV